MYLNTQNMYKKAYLCNEIMYAKKCSQHNGTYYLYLTYKN